MKKVYLKPDAEYISLVARESLTNDGMDAEEGESALPPGWGDDD